MRRSSRAMAASAARVDLPLPGVDVSCAPAARRLTPSPPITHTHPSEARLSPANQCACSCHTVPSCSCFCGPPCAPCALADALLRGQHQRRAVYERCRSLHLLSLPLGRRRRPCRRTHRQPSTAAVQPPPLSRTSRPTPRSHDGRRHRRRSRPGWPGRGSRARGLQGRCVRRSAGEDIGASLCCRADAAHACPCGADCQRTPLPVHLPSHHLGSTCSSSWRAPSRPPSPAPT